MGNTPRPTPSVPNPLDGEDPIGCSWRVLAIVFIGFILALIIFIFLVLS